MSITNEISRWIGLALFAGATIAVFYKFNWVKFFFYTWAFVILLNNLSFIPRHWTSKANFELIAMAVDLFMRHSIPLLVFYAMGRLINRIEQKKLSASWVDMLAITAFVAFLTYSNGFTLAHYLNDTYHFVDPLELALQKSLDLDGSSLYVSWMLFLWPIWTLELVVSAALAFVLTLPFYRLWNLKYVLIATVLIPALYLTPIFIYFIYYSAKHIWHVDDFLNEYAFVSLLSNVGRLLGIFFGSFCGVLLKKIFRRS